MAKKKAVRKKKVVKDDNSDIKPDGYVGNITAAEYWEWRCSIAEKDVATRMHENNLLMQRLLELEIEKKKSDLNVFKHTVIQTSSKNVETSKEELRDTKEKISSVLGHPIEGCIINEVFQVLKPEEPHGSDFVN